MQKNNRGRFICFEGGEGAGKGTVIATVHAELMLRGITCIATREPGGTAQGGVIRKALVESGGSGWAPAAELLLLMADRAQHVHELIAPALARGETVLCDRFVGSTIAYQGAGRGLPQTDILQAQRIAAGELEPDLTLLLDVDPRVGLARSKRRLQEQGSSEDAFERLDLAFHQRVRESFLAQAADDAARWSVIDTSRTQEIVAAEAIRAVTGLLGA
jgi:dTMP kinase